MPQGRATFIKVECIWEKHREYTRNLEGRQEKLHRSAGTLTWGRSGGSWNVSETGKWPVALDHLNARPPEQLRQMAVSMPFSNLSGGIVAVPQGPGLGIEIDREVLQTYC
jgi:hypothetical protein